VQTKENRVLNYYEGRYERNADGKIIDIAVWTKLVVTF
jgi:hypothetical protein